MQVKFALAAVMTIALSAAQAQAKDSDDYRIARGFKFTPVSLNLAGLDRAQVGLGSYLVNAAGGCNDCHSVQPFANGGDPYLGQTKKVERSTYLSGGRAFGPFISPNLTPNAKGRPPRALAATAARAPPAGRRRSPSGRCRACPGRSARA